MNRADRRAARRTMSRDHLGCGCRPRLLVPVEDSTACSSCGRQEPAARMGLPTAAPVGSLKTVYLSCAGCPGEVEVLCEVRPL